MGRVADGLVRRLVLATDDCDAVFDRLEAAGAEVMQEPIDRPGIPRLRLGPVREPAPVRPGHMWACW
ncbi:hypothetical protein ACN3XK_68550, partial [Actinomadura welshii]